MENNTWFTATTWMRIGWPAAVRKQRLITNFYKKVGLDLGIRGRTLKNSEEYAEL